MESAEENSAVKLPLLIAAATTSIGTGGATFIAVLNEWLRAGSAIISITAGLLAIAVAVKKLREKKAK